MDMSLSKLWELAMDRETWHAAVHGIFWSGILERVAIHSPGDLPNPGIEHVTCIAGGFFTEPPVNIGITILILLIKR